MYQHWTFSFPSLFRLHKIPQHLSMFVGGKSVEEAAELIESMVTSACELGVDEMSFHLSVKNTAGVFDWQQQRLQQACVRNHSMVFIPYSSLGLSSEVLLKTNLRSKEGASLTRIDDTYMHGYLLGTSFVVPAVCSREKEEKKGYKLFITDPNENVSNYIYIRYICHLWFAEEALVAMPLKLQKGETITVTGQTSSASYIRQIHQFLQQDILREPQLLLQCSNSGFLEDYPAWLLRCAEISILPMVQRHTAKKIVFVQVIEEEATNSIQENTKKERRIVKMNTIQAFALMQYNGSHQRNGR